MPLVGVIDYGAGNYASVRNALAAIGATVTRVADADTLQEATHLVLPGVGTFGSAMRKLRAAGLLEPLREELGRDRKPFLGICVGMQVLLSTGREFEECGGLGVIEGVVERVPCESAGLRLPHVGWSGLRVRADEPLFRGLGPEPVVYFVHSYSVQPADSGIVTATCSYGADVVAAIRRGNTCGVQFHPEKSQRDGLQLLRNFVSL